MAIISLATISPAEIQAVIATMTMWLRELPEENPRPAKAHFTYSDDGGLTLVVEVEDVE